jgi:phage N-6-adenine-methyltransferase
VKAHPIADIFPRMSAEDQVRLAHDIAERGLLEDIWTFEGQILDGRHRYAACVEAKVTPRFRAFEGTHDEAMAMSMSLNLARRHMTSDQRSALGAKIKKYEGKRAQERMCAGVALDPPEKVPEGSGDARDIAAAATGTNAKYVDQAEKISRDAPDVFERMEAGAYGSHAAAKKVAALEPELRERVHEAMDRGDSVKQAMRTAYDKDAWSTPAWVLDGAREIMGSIDTDPATNPFAMTRVGAEHSFTIEDDGLAQHWHGNVWLNPPYSNVMPWAEKLGVEFFDGRATQAMVLTNTVSSSDWYHELLAMADSISWPRGRIEFDHATGHKGSSNANAQTLFYMGDNWEAFETWCEAQGWHVTSPRARRDAALALEAMSQELQQRRALTSDPSTKSAAAKAAYRALSMRLHPDQGGDPEAFAHLTTLYEAIP